MATAQTACGRIRGREEDGLHVFRGIPYAAPPVGELRFRAPQPHPGWEGVRAAVEFGPIAIQEVIDALERLMPAPHQPQSEDCLFLNIWTPALDGARRPVMVWIHGGGYTVGSSSEPVYSGAHLAARGDVVVVSLNYRLNIFGFHNNPALTEINLGIRDQIAALGWVRENIANFGGDPENVTIFGESSGAQSVTTLMAAPSASGLFRRVISQSPDPHYPHHVESSRKVAHRICAQLGVEAGDLDALRALPAAELLAAHSVAEAEFMQDIPGNLVGQLMNCPILDGGVMPELPLDVIRSGRAAGIDLLIGMTDDEFRLYTTLFSEGEVDEGTVVAQLDVVRGDGRRVYDAYRDIRRARSEPVEPTDIFAAVLGDGAAVVPAERIADAHADAGGTAFSYVFDWKSPAFEGRLGACHAIDLPFTFGTHALTPDFVGAGPEVDALAEHVMDAWIAFARTGNPSTDALSWPSYSAETRPQMMLGPNLRVEHHWRAEEHALWEGLV